MKIVSAQASHKTEVGGVALNLASAEAVGAAATAMAERLARHVPGAKLDGFLVQEMVAGLELIVGVREDPQYGPFMLVGLGGVLVEALRRHRDALAANRRDGGAHHADGAQGASAVRRVPRAGAA